MPNPIPTLAGVPLPMSAATADAPAPTIDDPAYFDRLAAVEFVHWWPAAMWRLAAHWLDGALGGRVGLRALDVGCGTGGTLARLDARPELATVVGLDASPAALALARRHSARLLRADAFALPFPDAAFDLVTCLDVWQHLPADAVPRAARELRRVLRPGGFALLRVNGRGLWPGRRLGPRLYRLADLVSDLSAAGLAVRRATYANALPSVAQELLGRLRPRRPTGAHPAGRGLCLRVPPGWLNRLMSGVASLEAYAAGRLGARLPVGHSTMALATAPGVSGLESVISSH